LQKGNYFYPVGTLMQQFPISEARQEQITCELQWFNLSVSAPVKGFALQLVLRYHNQQCTPALERPGLMWICMYPKAPYLLSPSRIH